MNCNRPNLLFFFMVLGLVNISQAQKAKAGKFLIYEYLNQSKSDDTTFFTILYLNDSIEVRKEFFGKNWNAKSFQSPIAIDTFIVKKERWMKIFNGISYPFLSPNDVKAGSTIVEFTRGEKPPNTYNLYRPVKTIEIDQEPIVVYDMDVMYGHGLKLYDNTRVYFSPFYGIVGYINLDERILLKRFAGKLNMELRESSKE